jgi:hypothetical protein
MIMKKTLTLFCLTLIVLANGCVFGQAPALPVQFGPHQWTATVKVIGEDGNPVTGADVDVSYDIPPPPEPIEKSYGEIKGLTDTNGIISVTHTNSSLGLGITVNKSGYYNTHIGYQFYFDEKRRNPTFTSILKKVGKPIAMYAKRIDSLRVPEFNKVIGYDLMAGDWVGPYGKGINADLYFTEKHTDPQSGYILSVSFPNPGDGIQEFDEPLLFQNASNGQSDLRSAQNAPVDAYQPKFVQTTYNQNQNFYFRVRTKLDENGNVVSAHYGKIYGNLAQFTYYFNPTLNDRNIELDPKQNLLGGLQSFEQVSAP